VSDTQRAYVFPATHFASDLTDPNLPPMGLRVRLKASYDISGFPAEVQVILRALKKYGMIVADNGGPFYISGAPDPRWNDDLLHAITQVKGSDFEVVDTDGVTSVVPPPPAPPTPPVIAAGRAVSLRVGHKLSRRGRFADPKGFKWTATVNYGDGHGTKRLSFTKYKRFLLSHKYTRRGTYYVAIRVRNNKGLIGTTKLKVVVRR
jgi:hypothetical protein